MAETSATFPSGSTPIVLVHGFWHGSWCWSLVTQELAASGIASVALDLDGHGLKSCSPRTRWWRPFDPAAYATEPSAVADVSAGSAASTLADQIRRLAGGRPCVVVAHSMGGAVATALAELAPDLIANLVYLCAFAPVESAALRYVWSPENSGELVTGLLVADPPEVGALRLDLGDRQRQRAVREAFYGDVDDKTAGAAVALLQPDAPAGIPGEAVEVTSERFGSVPHTYIVCTADRAIMPALQRRFIAEIDAVSSAPTEVIEMDSAHSPFLSRPAELAKVLQTIHESTPRR